MVYEIYYVSRYRFIRRAGDSSRFVKDDINMLALIFCGWLKFDDITIDQHAHAL